MRLTDFQIQTICESAKNNFGKDTQVWLLAQELMTMPRVATLICILNRKLKNAPI